jgi:preprotein translocase YajC subunit
MTSLQLMMQLVVFSTIALGLVYFLFYRPTVEAQRKARRVVSDLQVGDDVVTHSGFFARVTEVWEVDDGPAVVSLDLGNGVIVRARVTAVAERLPADVARFGRQPEGAVRAAQRGEPGGVIAAPTTAEGGLS